MNFGTEFTELAATVGSDKKGKGDDTFLTPKQWALVVAAGLLLALGLHLWLRASGL